MTRGAASGSAEAWDNEGGSWRKRKFTRSRKVPAHDGGGRDLPAPITADRIGAELARREYYYHIDDDGDVAGTWDNNRFWFLTMGERKEIFQVRARWQNTLPEHMRLAALQAANDWNRDRLWPKVYVRPEDGLALYAEVSVDFEHGATDAQLADTITCGLIMASQFFDSLGILAIEE